ncbi:MAG: PDZ domain-containing protein [Gammaproteobacteria bacterium]|nr:PDZ domain-containing protein [Gammaproteobacteria bacterium]
MPSTRSTLITITAVLSLVILWIWFSADTKPEQLSEILARQNKLTQSNSELLKHINSLENKLIEQKTIQQEYEFRLLELEQLVNYPPVSSLEADIIEVDKEPLKPVKTTIKPPTLQEKLVSAGIPLDTIQRINQRIGENRLARLELRDQAIREDWIDTPEYIEKQQQLPGPTEGLREEFGDQTYDQYLYASGRPNRVIVREVFSGSAAESAGIEPGDILLSYASEFIYTMSDLQQATTEGYSGEAVLLEILRDKLPFSTSVPRGPLGISMTITRKEPE